MLSTGQWIVFLIIIAFTVFGTLLTVANIGKPRKPIDSKIAIGVIIGNSLILAGWGYVAGLWF